MTREEIIAMAREAGFEQLGPEIEDWICYSDQIERFACYVTAAEREACAKACDQIADDLHPFTDAWYNVCASAAAIRARGGE